MATNIKTTSPLSHFSFPRTGKRGVPQQFPRRLYEMLDSETKSVEASANHRKVITWSTSGKAFRIFDVAEFAASVLPKYFRTKKFSSFQRNLNLVRYRYCSLPSVKDAIIYFLKLDSPFATLLLSVSVWLRKSPSRSRHRHVCSSFVCEGSARVALESP